MSDVGGQQRPGVVSLADASQVSDDFIFLRTTRRSLDGLLALFDSAALSHIDTDLRSWLVNDPRVLLIRTADHLLAGYDRDMRQRLTIEANAPIEYELRLGVERLTSGIRVEQT